MNELVGDGKSLVLKRYAVVQENIQIYVPWAFLNGLISPHSMFNVLEFIEEFLRAQRCLDL